jgi:hypothetical protein
MHYCSGEDTKILQSCRVLLYNDWTQGQHTFDQEAPTCNTSMEEVSSFNDNPCFTFEFANRGSSAQSKSELDASFTSLLLDS